MGPTMATTQSQKQENPRSHLRIVRVERTPEEQLDLELAEAFAALEVAHGRPRPRRFYKIAEGELHPGRIVARVVNDARTAKVPAEAITRALFGPFKRYVARKYRLPVSTTGEFRPAA